MTIKSVGDRITVLADEVLGSEEAEATIQEVTDWGYMVLVDGDDPEFTSPVDFDGRVLQLIPEPFVNPALRSILDDRIIELVRDEKWAADFGAFLIGVGTVMLTQGVTLEDAQSGAYDSTIVEAMMANGADQTRALALLKARAEVAMIQVKPIS